MAITTIMQAIDLDGATYQAVNLGNNSSFYLISVTEDTNVKSISFAIAIDSGLVNTPLFIKNITIPVNGEEKVAGKFFASFPSNFYIKPIQVVTGDRDASVTEGQFDIEININPMSIDIG